MPMFKALQLCPDAVIVKPRMSAYAEASRAIRNMMEDPELPVVFVNGASGDITQVNNRDPFGRILACKVLC